MTTINDISDLIRVLNESPEWRQAVRGALLGEEFSRLPEQLALLAEFTRRNFELVNQRLDRVESDVTELKAGQARLEGDVAELKVGQARLESDVAELKAGQAALMAGQNRLAGRMDRGFGVNYEHRVGKSIHSLANRDLDLRQTRLLYGVRALSEDRFLSDIYAAEDDGLVNSDQVTEILELDLVFSGRRRSDGAPTHVAVEASITIDHSDIERAARRSEMLSAAVNQPVIPVVIGANIDREHTDLAAQNGVTVIVQPED